MKYLTESKTKFLETLVKYICSIFINYPNSIKSKDRLETTIKSLEAVMETDTHYKRIQYCFDIINIDVTSDFNVFIYRGNLLVYKINSQTVEKYSKDGSIEIFLTKKIINEIQTETRFGEKVENMDG